MVSTSTCRRRCRPTWPRCLPAVGLHQRDFSDKERGAFNSLDTFYKKYRAYGAIMGTRPQTIGYALADSPVGLAAWIFDYNNGEPERRLNRDDVLDNVTLYWLTNTATSAARLYWETAGQSVVLSAAQKTSEISLPVAISVFPDEVYRAPETWARRAYRNLIYFNELDKGGHFAAWEQPEPLRGRAPRRLPITSSSTLIKHSLKGPARTEGPHGAFPGGMVRTATNSGRAAFAITPLTSLTPGVMRSVGGLSSTGMADHLPLSRV